MTRERIEKLLRELQAGRLSLPSVLKRLQTLPYEDLGFASVDHHRSLRQGFPEVVFCEGKTRAQVVAIARGLLAKGGPLLATRVTAGVAKALKKLDRRAQYHELARTVVVHGKQPARAGDIMIVTAGTADVPVAEEARVTAEAMGSRVETLYDVGVAGIHRVLGRHERIRRARVLIVVAGMDGVLPSVVGGLVDRPVIAVPTSRGYGASFGGLAALLTMLNSCAAGVGVMNIDNGFGAGVLAHRINVLGER
ncbi:MAG: 1-(5-phosphoribosyl)-5-amino-4-imidazole-carboxylate carboxylase [Nitrospirae bacterium RIFCSPLOWO2_12_FULL_63_8]|nr:MAG: 1-(5-phosphoribosyl)-5-amino-4-imidazole-carboxylate carboxylase [Nitrospirae bacterium RIFCSPLOWO2_12_FULL_63_8]